MRIERSEVVYDPVPAMTHTIVQGYARLGLRRFSLRSRLLAGVFLR